MDEMKEAAKLLLGDTRRIRVRQEKASLEIHFENGFFLGFEPTSGVYWQLTEWGTETAALIRGGVSNEKRDWLALERSTGMRIEEETKA